ncbi:MAG: hypothetical protein AAGC56_00545 [Pseudomonadota bacterium]
MGPIVRAALFAVAAAAGLFDAAPARAEPAYAPMAPFAAMVGKTYRGEGTGPDGAPLVDIAKWEFILGGRAVQTTHRLEGGDYGGRTIMFFDEAAKTYVFHYFTTAGFHTIGEFDVTEDGFVGSEAVEGHPTYVSVYSKTTLDGDGTLRITSEYVDRKGERTPATSLTYRPIAPVGPLFAAGAGD